MISSTLISLGSEFRNRYHGNGGSQFDFFSDMEWRPWVLTRDFNSIIHFNDRMGGLLVRWNELEDFRDCISNSQLENLKSTGYVYTWNNKQETGDRIFTKIDRMLINEAWLYTFPASSYYVHPKGLSDQCTLILTLEPVAMKKKRSFKFVTCGCSKRIFWI